MQSPEMSRRVALVRTDISEEPSDSIIRATRIGELGTLTATATDAHTSQKTVFFTAGEVPTFQEFGPGDISVA
jgi:hypothetical protein